MNEPRSQKLSFRTQALLVSFGAQSLFILAFATAVLLIVSDRGERALRDNLAAATGGFSRNAAFVFISSLESNRTEFLAAATASPNIEAAFMTDPDYAITAITAEAWRKPVESARPQTTNARAPSIVDLGDNWIFFEPVFAADVWQCGELQAQAEQCRQAAELLGYVGVVGSKKMISSLTRNVAMVLFAAAPLLLASIYWATNRLAAKLYQPMLTLKDRTTQTADLGYRNKIEFSGPPEVEAVAGAINHLIDHAAANAEELERQVADKTKEERAARAIAEEARAVAEGVKQWRTEMMAINTHELLTPLRVLAGRLDNAIDELRFLPSGRTRDSISHALSAMRAPIADIEALVEQVNVAMLVEEGRIEMQPTLEPIAPMIERLRKSHAPAAIRRQNRLTFDNQVKGAVTTDHRMVETIISNLVSNACKFTHSGEINLNVEAASGILVITCRDTGDGISEAIKARIFDPLFQGDMSPRRTADGLGLGLSIVKGFVARLGGEIDLDSTPGAGSMFVVRLPLAQGGAAETAQSPPDA